MKCRDWFGRFPFAGYYAPKSDNRNESHLTLVPREHRLRDRQTCCENYPFGHQNPAYCTLLFSDIWTINTSFCISYVRSFPPKRAPSPPPLPPRGYSLHSIWCKTATLGASNHGDVTVSISSVDKGKTACEDFAMNREHFSSRCEVWVPTLAASCFCGQGGISIQQKERCFSERTSVSMHTKRTRLRSPGKRKTRGQRPVP